MFRFDSKISILLVSYILSVSPSFCYEILPNESVLEIKTPQLKDRKTLKIQLKNGIKALIISDPNIAESAIAVSVPVGSWNDPQEYPGMAHFCEHMLFMGTKKYPQEEEFFKFVNDHSGKANAYTAGDHTVYMFSSTNDAFFPGIDRLSHFFIDPLFPAASVSRELKAVDQENDKNIQNDGWRKWMIIKETGNQEHPNAKFSTGTAETLGKIPIEKLKTWYESHYTPENMYIVAISNQPLNTIAEKIDTDFSNVPKRGSSNYPKIQISSSQQKGHLIAIEPIHELRSLTLTWELTDFLSTDHSIGIIADIIQSRHDGSLFDILQKEELANGIYSSSDRLSNYNQFFEISISLTDLGVQHLDQVIEKIFQYIQLLKQSGIPLSFQKELKTMNLLDYEYQTQINAFEYVIDQIEELLSQPITTFPDHSYILENSSPEKLKKTLNLLKPDDCIFFLTAKPELSGIEAEKQEKWLGGKYSIKTIPQKQLEALNQIDLNISLKLPEANPLIPQNLELIAKAKEYKPELLIVEPIGKLYYEADGQFFIPQISIQLAIRSLLNDIDPKNYVFLDLLSFAFKQKNAALMSQANFAGLTTSIYRDGVGLKINLDGFSDKGKILWHNIFKQLKDLTISAEEFDQFKSQFQLKYLNDLNTAPYIQSFQKINYLTRNDSPLPEQLENSIQTFTLKDFEHLKKIFLNNTYLEMFCFGNLSSQDSVDYFETATDILSSQPIIPELIIKSKALEMTGKTPFKIQSTTDLMGNSALLMLQSKEKGVDAKASFLVLNQALKTSFFDTLRTKQQTGYIAICRGLEQLGMLQTYLIVQSTTHEPEELIARFELFLEDYIKNIQQEIPIDRFNLIKEELKKDLLKPSETISSYASKRFKEAFFNLGSFYEEEKIASILNSLNYDSFIKYSKEFLGRSNERRIAISISGENKDNKSLRYTTTTEESFKSDQSYILFENSHD